MSHEIYRSGYCKENITYFREWCRLPAEAYELVVIPSHITNVGASKFDDSADYSSYIHESPRLDGYDEFVMSGQSLDRTVRIREEYLAQHPDARPEDVDIVLGDKRTGLWVTWCPQEDKVFEARALPGNSDYGFSAGSLSNLLASYYDAPKEIYLLGHDLYSTTGDFVNNVYAGTDCYIAKTGSEIPPDNWIQQHKLVFDKFPNIKYYKVNPQAISDNDRISRVIGEWSDTLNLEYITQDEMYERVT
jgi:hypothetical protein